MGTGICPALDEGIFALEESMEPDVGVEMRVCGRAYIGSEGDTGSKLCAGAEPWIIPGDGVGKRLCVTPIPGGPDDGHASLEAGSCASHRICAGTGVIASAGRGPEKPKPDGDLTIAGLRRKRRVPGT